VNEQIETVIIGAGHAGLIMSYYLSQLGREHVLLERGRVAERWRSERWDSFYFQFPNWSIELPGYGYQSQDPDGFVPAVEIVRFLHGYADHIGAPVRCGVEVKSLQRSEDERYLLETSNSAILAKNVIIATGPFHVPAFRPASAVIPNDIFQVHSSQYRNPDGLPPGAVIVVGAGSSGCQIAEDLNRNGREVYLSVGRHVRVPRRYRGHDYSWWRRIMGFWDRTVDSLPSPDAKNAPVPLLSGYGGGYDVDFRRMADNGIHLLGHLQSVRNGVLVSAPDLKENLTKGDETFNGFKTSVDQYVLKTGMDIPDESPSQEDRLEQKELVHPILALDLKATGIAAIVWANGFRYDFDWVKVPVFDPNGAPVHRRGITKYPGLYFLGLRWLYKLKSAFLIGAGPAEDAAYIAERIK
jgi:putative flavoprotein involved in K+ transport